ncbi:helix-turn-helix domain-containing protein [Lactococcus lactis]|jgi:transcriptional regulator with XRE-family HTH domain|uniref:helix-turn-helix domain-containing protein n=1 Tax=Lactococcus lactis TaxID=1358 RepID=UPI0018A9F1F4|nr:helix-turn-helix transcriptional regulator [Lactococcus lactis]
MSVFAERLKELRKEKYLTQKEIANKLGVSRVAYTNWENSKREPNIERFVKLADYFNVSIDYLVGRKNHRK